MTSAPSLLKPSRLISAPCSGSRKMRGRGLPGCGWSVTVPTSRKPNPSAARNGIISAFLSNPAAIPIGESKSRSQTATRNPRGTTKPRDDAQHQRDLLQAGHLGHGQVVCRPLHRAGTEAFGSANTSLHALER